MDDLVSGPAAVDIVLSKNLGEVQVGEILPAVEAPVVGRGEGPRLRPAAGDIDQEGE